MSIRFTDTDKWGDAWFGSLSAKSKLLFMFLCDNCNIAGIIEVNKNIWSALTSLSISDINKSLNELEKCYIKSSDDECIFIKNFLKHQKNLPINTNNKAHIKILTTFENYKYKFENKDINDLINIPLSRGIKGGSKGDESPTGIGIGIGIGNKGGMGEKEDTPEHPKPEKRFNFRKALIDYGFREDLVDEWMKVRKAKKSVNTEKSFDDFIREVEKSGEDKNTLLEFIAVKKQWRGFQAKWLAEFTAPNEKLLTYDEVSDLVTDKKKTITFDDFDKKEIDGVMYWIPKKELR